VNDSSSIASGLPVERSDSSPGIAIVTGSTGQDGSYLRDLIGHEQTVGCINPKQKSTHTLSSGKEISIDLGDKKSVLDLLSQIRPRSIFHLAAKHGPSTKMTYNPEDIMAMNRIHVDATRNFLECIDQLGLETHLVVAGSSRVFTPTKSITVVTEQSEPNPNDYYGESKVAAWELVKHHRRENNVRASYLILFNHESPRRPQGYFSQDIAQAIQNFRSGNLGEILVRDADFLGDWSDARDVTALMAKVASSKNGGDYIVASGNLQSVRNVIDSTLSALGHSQAPVTSTSDSPSKESRKFLKADNSKSIESEVWVEKIKIHETILEILRLGTKQSL
jgi:GDPmannose 4,6-dehydratase